MYRPRKSILTAYALWLPLGWIGAHRFYLGRPGTGIMYALLCIGGATLVFLGYTREEEKMQLVGLLTVGLWGAGMIVDLFTIPGMVRTFNTRGDGERTFISQNASLDPSFQATMRKTGLDADGGQKSNLPDDFVLPWRQDDPRGQSKTYRPDDE